MKGSNLSKEKNWSRNGGPESMKELSLVNKAITIFFKKYNDLTTRLANLPNCKQELKKILSIEGKYQQWKVGTSLIEGSFQDQPQQAAELGRIGLGSGFQVKDTKKVLRNLPLRLRTATEVRHVSGMSLCRSPEKPLQL